MRGSNAILSAKSLMQQVYLPKIVFPAVTFFTDTFKFLVVFVLLVLFFVVGGFPVGWHYLALLFVLAVQALLVASLAVLFAAVTPFLPDLRVVLENVVRLWFFLSGVFYDIDIFSEQAQVYLRLNPMAVLLESYRTIFLEGALPDLLRLGVFGVLSAALLGLGVWILFRFDYAYPKLKL
jgi:lipopolysaccharide transport system permease protein